MNYPIRQQRWISYSLALLLTIALSWGLTQPALAAPEATQIGFNLSEGDPITGLTIRIRVQSNGGSEPITGSIIVQGSWGESCTKTLTAADNLPVPTGHLASSTCQMAPPLGIYTITITYAGNASYAPSSSQNIEIVSKYFADLVITAHTPNPSSVDQGVLVQYSVTAVRSLPFSPTGTVFVTDGVNSCISTPATGQCSLLLETSGTRTLTASYSGDSNFAADRAAANHTVIGYASTTGITADIPDPSTQGQAVTVSYSVVANDPSKGTPSGAVTVSDGVDSCTGTVAAGSCSLTLNTPGARTLTATYAGNTKFASSTSAAEPHTVNVIDTTPPVITVSGSKANGTPYTTGTWTNQNVLVHFTCSDAGSGIAVCPGDQVISPDGSFTAEGTARDNAGNTATASFGPIQIDKTAPAIIVTGVNDGATYTLGSVPTAACSTTDALSGVATQATRSITGGNPNGTGSFTATCSGATDNAGNSAAPASVSYSITPPPDDTAPVITPQISGVLGDNGWYTSDVTLSWAVVDAESTISSQNGCEAQHVTSDTSGVTFTCTATSAGGSSSESVTVKRDATAPTITVSGTKADGSPYTTGTWTNQNVTVHFTCSDAGSGIGVCPGDQVISPDGSFTAEGTARDNAGNSATASFGPIQIDKTAPTISAAATSAPNANHWYNDNVTIHFTCADSLSSVTSCPADQVLSSEGAAVASTAQTVSDLAGNSSAPSNVVTVQIDKTAPVVAVTGVSNGALYTLGSVPAAGCSTTDALAGVATQATLSVTGGNGDGTGSFTATCSAATDNAGNSNSASVTYSVQGTLIGGCGPYTVYQVGSNYTAAGWSGTIKVGTSGNNTLTGGNGPDLILGLGGNDLLKGNGGDDLLCGGDGVDLLQGLADNDLLDGGNGHDVLNGGSGDYDALVGGEGNDVLLDGDGVRNASGGAGNDLFTLALRYGWRDGDGQARFSGLTAGYGNDVVGLAILNSTRFFVDISGDERDTPASPLEGNDDGLALAGVIDPASTLIKFEHQAVLSADATVEIPSEEAGAEYLTEPVGEESVVPVEQLNYFFLPLVNR